MSSMKSFKASHAMLPRSVLVLLAVPEESRGPLTAELVAAGHVVRNWQPDEPVPPQAAVAIVDGLAGIEAASQAQCHLLALLDASETSRFLDFVRLPSDFVLKPTRHDEVAARVTHLAVQPTWRERTMHRLFALAIERTSDVIEVTDPQARFQYVNPAYERTLGIPRSEAIGKTPAELVRSDYHPPEFWKKLDETLQRGETYQGTLVSRSRAGRQVHLDTTITPIADRRGRFTHHVGVKRDITERLERAEAMLQANRALEKARDAALAASRAKSEFLANMSHELRTPLNAIIGYSEMLMDDLGDPTSQMHEDLKRIRSAGGHLLTLIDDVLDISKIEADRVDILTENIAVSDLVGSVEETIRPLAEANKNQFVATIEEGVTLVRADRTRLRQVLFNLVSNANKFTKGGTVSLTARSIEKDGARWVELDVTDTGIGITKEQQAKLFQPFVQADSSTTREYGGTGLGLVICKRLTEMMGGSIELESEKGRGTTIRVCIPPGDTKPDSEAPMRDDDAGHAPVVLVIDDEENDRELVARVLAKRGFHVEVASSGQAGIELAARLKPAAIVLDVNMPRMSGWDVLSALKLSEKTSSIPVVMLTVMHQEEIGRALGAVDYLIKPLQPRALVEVLRRHVPTDTGRVLVVEDDEPTRELMTRTLRSAGHVVVEAENGKIALDRLAEAAPQVIVLDLMMPVMDGMMFLHHLRAMEAYANVPVIVATAQILTDADRAQLAASAQQIIEKKAHSRSELLSLIADEIRARIGEGAPLSESEVTSE
ncbi:MAG: response regulator [Labilithrix sp.]|nr:response regulator [Labilithrix sp.]MCW5809739.1 response regulator [Labilithrix sp.]